LKEKYPFATFKDLTGKVWYAPETEFVEEFTPTTGETLIWNAPKPSPVELDFDEERARAEYPEEFVEEYKPEEFDELAEFGW
jgi:hypothetical protein